MGPLAIGSQGSGASEGAGLFSLFSNPAGAHVYQGQEMAVGISDLNTGLFPFVSYGNKSSRLISYSLMYYGNQSINPDSTLQGIMANVSYYPNTFFKAGINVYSQSLNGKFASDMAAGLQYFPNKRWKMGIYAANLSESKFGSQKSAAYFPRLLSAGFGYQPFAFSQIHLDVLSPNGDVEEWFPVASLGIIFGRINQIRVQPALRGDFENHENLLASLRVELNSNVEKNRLGFAYAISGLGIYENSTNVKQSVAIKFQIGLNVDKENPICSAEEKKGSISLLAGSENKEAIFHLSAYDEQSPLKNWQFVICNQGKEGEPDKMIKSFSGRGLPPKFLMWDGRNSSKELVSPGYYYYRLVVQDAAGNAGHSAWQLLEVKN